MRSALKSKYEPIALCLVYISQILLKLNDSCLGNVAKMLKFCNHSTIVDIFPKFNIDLEFYSTNLWQVQTCFFNSTKPCSNRVLSCKHNIISILNCCSFIDKSNFNNNMGLLHKSFVHRYNDHDQN